MNPYTNYSGCLYDEENVDYDDIDYGDDGIVTDIVIDE